MQTMDMGSADAALTQMSAVPSTASSSSYFLQLDPSGHVDILESSLVLSKPDVADETVYEIQLDPFMLDERNVEVVNLQNFSNSVTYQPEFYDEHNNLIQASFNAPQIQYQIDDVNFNQMFMNNTFTAILPAAQGVPTLESQETIEVNTVPDFTVETEVCSEMEVEITANEPSGQNEQIINCENESQELLGKCASEVTPQELESSTEVKKDENEAVTIKKEETSNSVESKVEEAESKAPTKSRWEFPEKLWNFTEAPVMPLVKEMYPSSTTPSTITTEPPPVFNIPDEDKVDMDEKENDDDAPFNSEFFDKGLDPDDELYISYLKRPDESKNAMCILCYEWFLDSSELDAHLKSEHQDKMVLYGCKRCGKQFWSRFLRQRHEKTHRYDLKGPIQRYFPKNRPFDHYESKHFLKRLRPAPFTNKYVEQIRLIHSQIKSTEYECIQCGKDFQTEEEYSSHYEENHALQTCHHCQEIFENAKLLRKHQRIHGLYQVKKNYPGGAWKLWESSWVDCQEMNEKDDNLVSHFLYHNYSKRPMDENKSNENGGSQKFFMSGCEEITIEEYDAAKKVDVRRKSSSGKSHGSSKSKSHSSSFAESTKGKKNDSKVIPIPDDDYDKIEFIEDIKYSQPYNSKKKDLPFKCDTCKMSFDTDADLQRHVKTHSIRAMAYMCQYCGRGFATHSNRKEHERIHTGDKPYVCPICSRAFVQISNLKKHIQTHKDKNNLQCSTCNKQFVKESSLILHQRAHSQDRKFRCHICDRAYNYASLLKRHMRIHTGENPYSCDLCGMQFHELVSLHYHRKKVHTGERPHRCDECGRAFILSSDLKKHLKIHSRTGNSIKLASSKSSTPKDSPTKNVPSDFKEIPGSDNVEGAEDNSVKFSDLNHPTQSNGVDVLTSAGQEMDFVPAVGQSISDASQVLVITETDLLKTTLNNEKDEVINNETKENCLVLSSENHV